MTDSILSYLTQIGSDPGVLGTAIAVWLVLRWGARAAVVLPPGRRSLVRRILPLLPEVIAVGVCLGGLVPTISAEPWPVRAGAGLWIAYVSGKIHKVLGQTILGDDRQVAEREVNR